jgi:hypothetical protein
MLHCPGGCALRAPRSARSRYKVDVAVRRRWASPSFIQFVYSDRFKVSHFVYELSAEFRGIFSRLCIRYLSTIFFLSGFHQEARPVSATSSRHCLPPG